MFPAKDREVSAIENSIKVNRINHVVSVVADTARSLEFYSGFLGIKQIPSQVDNPAITWLQLPSGIMLHLVESQDGPAQPPNLHHAFEVEDLDAATAAVEDRGIPIESLRGQTRRPAVPVHSRPRREPGWSCARRRASSRLPVPVGLALPPLPAVGSHGQGWDHCDQGYRRRDVEEVVEQGKPGGAQTMEVFIAADL